MMHWTDTHCHLDAPELAADIAGVLERAEQAGVGRLIVPGVTGGVRDPGWPGSVARAWGVHPCYGDDKRPEDILAEWARCGYRPVAIGECGLDVKSDVPMCHQIEIFTAQAEIARRSGLPLLVHLRGAWDKARAILRDHAVGVPWIMHAFSGPVEIARHFLADGAVISFAGSLCMPQARKTPAVARDVPIDRLVFETDAPDLKPYFFNAPCNEPASLPGIAAYLADLRGVAVEEIQAAAASTVRRIFG
ncbi:MAG TPA: TatD family hydrolase [Candidatus Ozemobacteraceae bacterium]|nr:TatD family hydrolase [Candidatus Ozemobacteraceae bacterium]HQG28385.1 TatD family hydrolase [Candidatus Ozemobacteraceae bacterium]